MSSGEELTQINVALNFPVTMAMLPWLQPRLAPAIIKHGYQSREFQVAVEDMIIRRPYELAFASVSFNILVCIITHCCYSALVQERQFHKLNLT